mmetsp:Transcript_66832/g.168788  ORF Transcript_66832/g.168788 Transcript_66832/m.168788 type:complete len:288 (-) Transcript_66832:507-1370(-)
MHAILLQVNEKPQASPPLVGTCQRGVKNRVPASARTNSHGVGSKFPQTRSRPAKNPTTLTACPTVHSKHHSRGWTHIQRGRRTCIRVHLLKPLALSGEQAPVSLPPYTPLNMARQCRDRKFCGGCCPSSCFNLEETLAPCSRRYPCRNCGARLAQAHNASGPRCLGAGSSCNRGQCEGCMMESVCRRMPNPPAPSTRARCPPAGPANKSSDQGLSACHCVAQPAAIHPPGVLDRRSARACDRRGADQRRACRDGHAVGGRRLCAGRRCKGSSLVPSRCPGTQYPWAH